MTCDVCGAVGHNKRFHRVQKVCTYTSYWQFWLYGSSSLSIWFNYMLMTKRETKEVRHYSHSLKRVQQTNNHQIIMRHRYLLHTFWFCFNCIAVVHCQFNMFDFFSTKICRPLLNKVNLFLIVLRFFLCQISHKWAVINFLAKNSHMGVEDDNRSFNFSLQFFSIPVHTTLDTTTTNPRGNQRGDIPSEEQVSNVLSAQVSVNLRYLLAMANFHEFTCVHSLLE